MKYKISVEDSFGNESFFEIDSANQVSEARLIARNKHIMSYKLDSSKFKIPTIWTFLEGKENDTQGQGGTQ